jgi:hypothetical protein
MEIILTNMMDGHKIFRADVVEETIVEMILWSVGGGHIRLSLI